MNTLENLIETARQAAIKEEIARKDREQEEAARKERIALILFKYLRERVGEVWDELAPFIHEYKVFEVNENATFSVEAPKSWLIVEVNAAPLRLLPFIIETDGIKFTYRDPIKTIGAWDGISGLAKALYESRVAFEKMGISEESSMMRSILHDEDWDD